ncbi:integral membrane protein [Stachybotrys elegans]|uniref:Integral membrane protein n=1 Tax=Stachybotrys elegans TaxID=80388 RepID=A0A8K0WJF1_9HYPO|nr:integral membrane protein [Stachybotrys elegans]
MAEVINLPMLPVARQHVVGLSVLAGLGTTCIALRLYGRHFTIGYGWDDLLIVIAWMFSMSLVAEAGFLGTIGCGYDLFPTSPHYATLLNNLTVFMQVILSFQLLYMMALTFVKLSVLVFYQRIFVSPGMKKLVYATIGLIIVWCISHSLAMLFICHPTAFWWDQTIPGGYCLNQIPIYISLIITNIFTDIVIMLLPMLTIWELKMKTTEKLALTAAFSLGIASIAIAVWRLVTVFQVDLAQNITGSLELAVFLCTLETVLALLCVNIPLLRPLYRRFILRQWSSKIDELSNRYATNGDESGGPSRAAEMELDNYSKSRGFEHSTYVEETHLDGDSGSERKLNPYNKGNQTDIVVKTEWTVNRE